MNSRNLYSVDDAGVLRIVCGGLAIVRRRKHEYLTVLEELTRQELIFATNKREGSKFLPKWTLNYLCDWIEGQIQEAKWSIDIQEPNPLFVRLEEEIGLLTASRCIQSAYAVTAGRFTLIR